MVASKTPSWDVASAQTSLATGYTHRSNTSWRELLDSNPSPCPAGWPIGTAARTRVRLILKSFAPPFEAALIRVESVRHAGLVSKVTPGALEVALTGDRTGTETVYVQPGAVILRSEEDGDKQELVPFTQIKVGDSIVYFGLAVCQDSSKFNAYVVVIVGG